MTMMMIIIIIIIIMSKKKRGEEIRQRAVYALRLTVVVEM